MAVVSLVLKMLALVFLVFVDGIGDSVFYDGIIAGTGILKPEILLLVLW